MMETQTAHALILALYLAPLMVAAGYDLVTYRIPNVVSGAMAVLFPLAALLSPTPVDWLDHLGGGGLMLVGGILLYALRAMGGGDVKLLAALGLWQGLDNLLFLALAVSVAGGVVTLVLLTLRKPVFTLPLAARVGKLPEILSKDGRIPYALAITAGGVLMVNVLPL